jgi:hypothetical protein
VALWPYALVSLAELKDELTVTGYQADAKLESVIARASELIEAELGGEVVTRGAQTEYYTRDHASEVLQLAQWPVIAVTTAKEGAHGGAGSWVASTTLVSGTDYVLDKAAGVLLRISGGSRCAWAQGFESVQVVYRAGYADTAGAPVDAAAIPAALKDVALAVASRKYNQMKRGGDQGAQSQTDGFGTVSRFVPGDLLRAEREMLAPFKHWHYGSPIARRA